MPLRPFALVLTMTAALAISSGCATPSTSTRFDDSTPLTDREVRVFAAGAQAGIDCMTDWAREWSLPTPESAEVFCRAAAASALTSNVDSAE